MNDVSVATDQVNTLERDLRSVLIQLQNTIQSKTAVPTNQVFTYLKATVNPVPLGKS